jgi:hypothetical protein
MGVSVKACSRVSEKLRPIEAQEARIIEEPCQKIANQLTIRQRS